MNSIPVGLPTVMSVTMAVGAKQLAKRQVIIKRLTAVEELSSVSILCTDKTGTLTLNELTLDEPYLPSHYTKDDILLYAHLACETTAQDPIELAVRDAAEKYHPQITSHEVHGYTVQTFTPFNPTDKMARATVLELGTQRTFQAAKGAPQVIINLCGGHADAEKVVEDMASRGLRCLGVARTVNDSDHEWELVGLLTFLDPPRPDSAATLNECANNGIAVKMITGDQAAIASEVAGRLGMGQMILDADYIANPARSENEVIEDCLRADGFARVIPGKESQNWHGNVS